jgi:hypothetical protein
MNEYILDMNSYRDENSELLSRPLGNAGQKPEILTWILMLLNDRDL